ncbi:hypothetical protein [Ferruginibacter albus]|uniref:hypothetical protein n=1 Tax=Ferruginibacter albus TaxID=2875540 RepID=UPI001CC56A5E|nr:hypothetical protein [Ferruginibacter albus]UAY52026.1 hypothetical protein K9M53_15710 [Ferruginibacter albus]
MDPKNKKDEESKSDSLDEGTTQRVHEHLKNQNDIISDDDLKNAKIDHFEIEEIKPSETTKEKISSKDPNSPSINTVWNILDEE